MFILMCWNISSCCSRDDPTAQTLQSALERRKRGYVCNFTIANDDVHTSIQNRLDERYYIVSHVLVVGVCVDNNISVIQNGSFQSGCKRPGKSLVARETYNMVDAMGFCYSGSLIAAAIVNDECLNFINPGNRIREGGKCLGQRLSFIETGNCVTFDNFFL